jgi:hypothetical protein
LSKTLTVSRNGSQPPLALTDMHLGQLEEAEVMLDQIAGLHDHANTAARLLQGVVLIELKQRIDHGKWGDWLKRRYEKSQDTAGRCMRAANDFLVQLQDAKFRSTAEFDLQAGVDLLRQDLTATLAQLETAKLDLSHPLVRAAALYANGRSFYQLCLDLGPAHRGGDTSKHRKSRSNKSPEEVAAEEAQIYWAPVQKKLFELLHCNAKERLLDLPITEAPPIASLTSLQHQVESLNDIVREALKQRRSAQR